MLGCNGQDMVKVRQGKPVKKETNGCREEGRWRPCEAGSPLRRQRRIRPSRVDRPNGKAECAETCLLRLERGKGCKALPIATRVVPSFNHDAQRQTPSRYAPAQPANMLPAASRGGL